MNERTRLAALALALAVALPAALPSPRVLAAPQDGAGLGGEGGKAEGPAPPSEDEVKEFCKDYEKTLRKMTDEDAIAGIEKMRAWYTAPGAEDGVRKEILGSFKKAIDQRGRDSLLEAAAKAMGDFGEDAVNLLKYLVEKSMGQKVPSPGVVRAGIASLGKIASPKGGDVKFLTDLLKKDDEFIPDAARALAGYAKSPGSVRRDIFEELLKMSEGVFSKKEANDPPAKRRWNIWGTDVVDAMQKLSRTNLDKPPDFRRWFNDKDEGGGKNPRTWADEEK